MSRRALSLRAIILLAAWLLPCAATAATAPAIDVCVSIPPLAYVVDRIGGEQVRAHVMIPPGASPENHAPTPRQLESLERARLFVLVGHPDFVFEQSYVRPRLADRPDALVVEMAGGPRRAGEEADGDPHIWVSPRVMQKTARDIADALCRLDPVREADYRAGLADFLADLAALDAEIRTRLAPHAGGRFLVFHPAWEWFAREYGLVQVAIEREGKEPGPRQLIPLIEEARRQRVRTVFVQPGFTQKSAEIIAREIGAELSVLDPLASDWIANLRSVSEALARALSEVDAREPR